MFLYVVIVWYDGYEAGKGEVLGHYRTQHDAVEQGMRACAAGDDAHFNVYVAVF